MEEIVILAQQEIDEYKYQQNNIIMSDDDIILKYSRAFNALTKRSMDIPRNICLSCERLCYRRNVRDIRKLQISPDNQIWRALMLRIQQTVNPQYICDYCLNKIRQGLMSAYCILNNLSVNDVPEEIIS